MIDRATKETEYNNINDYFNFVSIILNYIEQIHQLHICSPRAEIYEDQQSLQYAKGIWQEFINEPGEYLNPIALANSKDPYIYALSLLYESISRSNLRPNQGKFTNDEDMLHPILICLSDIFQNEVFKSRMDSVRRGHQKNRQSLKEYIGDLKDAYDKLMVVRIDFAYCKMVSKTSFPVTRLPLNWEFLLSYVQRSFADSLVGYSVKFEWGNDKGLHAHSVFLFDGNVVCNDATIGMIIGEYWEKQITAGIGLHFNCNTSDHKARLLQCALGTFTGREEGFWNGVWIIADYLSKPDALVRLLLPTGTQIFRRGSLNAMQKQKLAKRRLKLNAAISGGTDSINQ